MTGVKICGLQPGDDLGFATHPLVTHVGFMFVPSSRRYVAPEAAARMTAALPGAFQAIGVFVNADTDAVLRTLTTAGVRVAQLHGDETPADCAALRQHGHPVWRAVSVPTRAQSADEFTAALCERIAPYLGAVDAILLDAAPPKNAVAGVTGGHGVAFDWTLLPTALRAIADRTDVPVWVAGGITPDNVAQLLTRCNPYGIDVSSGVELNGRKSSDRIYTLLEAVETHGH